jgi:exosortase
MGLSAIVIPTMRDIARVSWDTEQGAHGPIVLAIAVWLLVRSWPDIRRHAEPGSAILGGLALAIMLLAYIATHIVGSITLQSAATYGALVSALYLLVGWRSMRAAWFPILYFLFVLPPPGSFVALATQPLRLEIAELAVKILSWFGLPVARSGLLIYVAQYTLEVKAACGGLNSIISLTAVGLFYAYALHRANVRYCAVLTVVALCCAILANLCRVMLLMLITYGFGERAAQGFLHGVAGMFMFVVALAGVIAFDHLVNPLRRAVAK